MKLSLIIILISGFLSFFFGKKISLYALGDLKKIAQKAQSIDIEKDFETIEIIGRKDDEINILAERINESFLKIQKQASHLKQFITDVSHEFKTPLMVMNSQIDLYKKKLEKKDLTKTEIQSLLTNIKQKSYKLNQLLETFLLLSRMENNIQNLRKTHLNISEYLPLTCDGFLDSSSFDGNIHYKIQKEVYTYAEE